MGIFSNFFAWGKPKVSIQWWARFALDQLFSEKWDRLQKEFYLQIRECIPEEKVSEELFLSVLLAAQLDLLGGIAQRVYFYLGEEIMILAEMEYINKLPLNITCVQIMIEKAQPNPYRGDSNQMSPIPILVGK